VYQTHQFPSKDVLVEVVLNLFVGDVDTELLKWVCCKVLKAEYVQDTYSGTFITETDIKSLGTIMQEENEILYYLVHSFFSADQLHQLGSTLHVL
jgi:hypothetical protein